MGAYYSSMKFFHYPEKLEDLAHGRQTAPIHIRIKPTNTCNHRCWYCGYQNDAAISLGEGLDTRDYIPRPKMLEIARDLTEMKVRAVTFSGGGEPLTYKYFEEFFDLLDQGGVKTALLTNGALLRGRKAEILANRASWVRVSMDGWDDESYAYYRGVKGREFSKISENLAAFAKIKGSTVFGVSLNVDIKNHPHLQDFVRKIKDAGVDHVKISGCVVSNNGAENNAYHAPFFEDVNRAIDKARAECEDSHFKIVNAYHEMPDRFEKDYGSCPFSRFLTIIAADLNVYTCQDKAYTPSGMLGSIRDKSFREFWLSEDCTQALVNLDPSIHCAHHCVADRKNRFLLEYLQADEDHLSFV